MDTLNQHTEALLKNINDYFDSHNYNKDILASIYISSSPNPSSSFQRASIGLVEQKKRVSGHLCHVFTLYLHGSYEEGHTYLGIPFGDIRAEHIPIILHKLSLERESNSTELNSWIADHVLLISVLLSDYLI